MHLPLTLVSCPAGYGQSTLISHWLEECGHPAAWVSLDENHSDPRVFLNYVLSAIRTLFPDAAPEIHGHKLVIDNIVEGSRSQEP